MILWSLPLVPAATGALVWMVGARGHGGRGALGGAAVTGLLVLLGLALWCATGSAATELAWGGGLALSLQMTPIVAVAAVLVPVIAAPVVAWAAAHEDEEGLARLLGLLVVFAGTMELLVLASDLLTLALAWELVAGISWALIGHHWRERGAIAAADYSFNATRLGGFGLWVAAAAAIATGGELAFDSLPQVAAGPWGDAMAAGILVAAASKSAQGPFAPWLFRAMEGPSAASALLHSSTMVAAGAWILIRLHEPLAIVSWFGDAAIALGLGTALAGGVVAAVQPHAKRLLAASTSAQYGFMFAAIGAGYAGAALAHLVTHAALKALLFLAAGTAIGVAGSAQLRDMRLGRRLPAVAVASGIGALALAAVPPLGAAWSKEQVVAATGHVAPWLALVTMAAGGLSAWYAVRFQRLAYGRGAAGGGEASRTERGALWGLAALCLAAGIGWLPQISRAAARAVSLELPPGKTWELLLSIAVVIVPASVSWVVHGPRQARSASTSPGSPRLVADWLGLPAAIDVALVRPVAWLARACAQFDDRVVDAGVRGAALVARRTSALLAKVVEIDLDRLVAAVVGSTLRAAALSRRADDRGLDAAVDRLGRAAGELGERSRMLQTGLVPTYYSLLTGGLLALALALFFWR